MSSPQFDPISMALSLMDQSSLGYDFNAFSQALELLEKAMDILVNGESYSCNCRPRLLMFMRAQTISKHSMTPSTCSAESWKQSQVGYDRSSFCWILELVLSDSQKRANQMRRALESSRDLLQTRRDDLMELWLKSVRLKEMLRMVDSIAELREAPEKVDILLNQKYYLQALGTVLKSLQTMAAPEYAAVLALNEIKQSLERIYAVSI